MIMFSISGESGKPGTGIRIPGPPGPKGDRGAVGAKGDKGEDGKSGVQYVRWGRTTCPSGADIVYKGRGTYNEDFAHNFNSLFQEILRGKAGFAFYTT